MARYTNTGNGKPGGGNGVNKDDWGFGQIVGSEQGDHLKGTKSGDDTSDEIHGLAGRDNINGYDGEDQIFGGADADNITGGRGDDLLGGGAYEDFDPSTGTAVEDFVGEGTVFDVNGTYWWDGDTADGVFEKVTLLESGGSFQIDTQSGDTTTVGAIDEFDNVTTDGATDIFKLGANAEENGYDIIVNFEAAEYVEEGWVIGDVIDATEVEFDLGEMEDELTDNAIAGALGDKVTLTGEELEQFVNFSEGEYLWVDLDGFGGEPGAFFAELQDTALGEDTEPGGDATILVELPTATLTDFDPTTGALVTDYAGEGEVFDLGGVYWWDGDSADGEFEQVTLYDEGGDLYVDEGLGQFTTVGEVDGFDTWEIDEGTTLYYAVADGGTWDIFEA